VSADRPSTQLIREALRSDPRGLAALARSLEEALEREPGRGELHLARGLCLLYRDQDFDAARAAFAAARERSSQPLLQAEAWLEEAHALELLGSVEAARGAAEAAIALFPPDSPRRGNAAFLLARLEAARGELERAADVHKLARSWYESSEGPGLAEYHGFEAWLAERRRDPRAWVRAVRALLARDPRALALRRIGASSRRAPRRRIRRLLRMLLPLERALRLASPEGWPSYEEARADLAATLAFEGLLLHLLARPRRALKKLRRAIAEGERRLATVPRDPERTGLHALALHVTGRCLLARRRPFAATLRLTRAAELAPHPDVLLDLARARERSGDLEGARATLEALAELEPRPPVLARLARTAEALDRKEEALGHYLRATAQGGRHERAFAARIGLLLADLGRDEDARTWLDRALRQKGGDPELLLARGRVLARLGRARRAYRDVANAVSALEATVTSESHDDRDLLAEARFQQGEILFRLGRPAEAMTELDRCLAVDPAREDALLLKGDCAHALGRPREAVDFWKQVIDKKLGEKILRDGVQLYEEGKYVEALRKYREAFERFPQGWELFYRTAQAYARLGESAPALKYLAIALKIDRKVRMLLDKDPAVARLRGDPELRGILGERQPGER
jgi:tetratricopeptide (TPR) repeat protein